MTSKLTLNAVAAAAALFFAADAGAQAKSDIKADPKSANCTENCIDAGYEWAIANTPSEDADCAAANEDFAAGCAHWLEETREAAAPPLEEPVATDATGTEEASAADSATASEEPSSSDSATAAASEEPSASDTATATQVDDSAAPPSDAPADPSNPPSGKQ